MSFKDALKTASSIVNSVLGDVCTYEHTDGAITNNTHIVIDRNKMVLDDMGIIAGYRVEASILKSEIPKIFNGEFFHDEENTRWEITMVTKETVGKWYVNIIEI